ncbi:hypothetical protein O7634_03470 [Micromonospora sp. WMMD1120]|uniref:hypothetical protein n=1 Tax=Micromonospora sp. WMMD1120 TaxID=3016106 RepID=UPI0024173B98|nr:hypothetical protein [Micromonospora sp. WMMD1120]MDG4805812.1 hypothetical protein [Micromonospora sp. WMMD1120]
MDDPTRFLTEPAKPESSISNGFVNPIDLFNYVSPSAWINATINKPTGVDVFGWMTTWLSGDWEAIWKFGDAMGNLAACLQQVGINIQQGMLDLDRQWDGHANDAAHQYFSRLASATSGQQLELYKIRDNYHKAANGAWQLSNQLGNILQALADKAVIAGIAAAAGTITAETGVGAVVGYGVAALMVVDMLALINKASLLINTAGTVILGLFGTAMDVAYQGGDLSTIKLPALAYTAPGA